MSAATCVIYYGLRYEVSSSEIDSLETRSDERIAAARKAGLKFYWGNFGSPDERYLLFVGAQVGIMGPENQAEVQLSDAEFDAVATSVRTKLASAGFEGSPQLHVQWQDDL